MVKVLVTFWKLDLQELIVIQRMILPTLKPTRFAIAFRRVCIYPEQSVGLVYMEVVGGL